MSRQNLFFVAGGLLLTFLGGLAAATLLADDDSDIVAGADPTATVVAEPESEPSPPAPPTPTATPLPAPEPTATGVPDPTPDEPAVEPAPQIQILDRTPPPYETAVGIAQTLAVEIILPSDCGLPLDEAISLPNSPRDYRSGTHQGIDFICLERGRTAVAALDGRVVVAVGDYVDPTPADREAVLAIAAGAQRTPPYTLNMLFGNYVVIDHGNVDGVGHLITIYAHFEQLADTIRPGALVRRGDVLGEIGNKGTEPGSTGVEQSQSLHLHWEIHVDEQYLGAGLDAAQTREVYRDLFAAGS